MSVLVRYIEELGSDTHLDELNVRDMQMKLPGIKHKWAGRLIRSRIELLDLFSKKKKSLRIQTRSVIDNSPIKMSEPLAEKQARKHESVISIDEEIAHHQHVIEFLEKAEKILNSMTFDIKNLIEIMKLETL